jgi:hypothetical protein
MEVFYRYDWSNLRGQNALCDGGKALWAYPNQYLRKEVREGGVEGYYARERLIGG